MPFRSLHSAAPSTLLAQQPLGSDQQLLVRVLALLPLVAFEALVFALRVHLVLL